MGKSVLTEWLNEKVIIVYLDELGKVIFKIINEQFPDNGLELDSVFLSLSLFFKIDSFWIVFFFLLIFYLLFLGYYYLLLWV